MPPPLLHPTACEWCTRRKQRCDRAKPSCGQCVAAGKECKERYWKQPNAQPTKRKRSAFAEGEEDDVPSRDSQEPTKRKRSAFAEGEQDDVPSRDSQEPIPEHPSDTRASANSATLDDGLSIENVHLLISNLRQNLDFLEALEKRLSNVASHSRSTSPSSDDPPVTNGSTPATAALENSTNLSRATATASATLIASTDACRQGTTPVESLPGVGDAYSYPNAARQEQEQQDASTASPTSSTDASRPHVLATNQQVIPLPGVGSSGVRFSDTPAPTVITVTSINRVNPNFIPIKTQITNAERGFQLPAFLLPMANQHPFSVEHFCRYIVSAPDMVFQKVKWLGKCSFATTLYHQGINFEVSSTWLEEKLHLEQNVSSCSSASSIFCQWICEEYKVSGMIGLGQPEFSNKVFWWSYFRDSNLNGEGIVWPIAIGNITVGWAKSGCFMHYVAWEKKVFGGQTERLARHHRQVQE